jgi:DNA-binding IclR family transcriptional regulator
VAWWARDELKETLRGAARPFMGRLLGRFEQTVNLGILDLDQILYAEIAEGLRSIRMAATVNTYAPFHSTALGKCILAFLDGDELERIVRKRPLSKLTSKTITSVPALMRHLRRVRERGYAVDNEETERGARCVAAPIFNSGGRPVAAISVSGPITYVKGGVLFQIARALMKSCHKISEQLGFVGVKRLRRA